MIYDQPFPDYCIGFVWHWGAPTLSMIDGLLVVKISDSETFAAWEASKFFQSDYIFDIFYNLFISWGKTMYQTCSCTIV